MNLKAMRNVHLYLGCFFAPLLIFFVVSGCWQTFGFHHTHKSDPSYKPPVILQVLSHVHMDQRLSSDDNRLPPSKPFKYLVVLMTLGFGITTLLGIVMAFKFTKPWVVWACLFLGIAVPGFLLWVARVFR